MTVIAIFSMGNNLLLNIDSNSGNVNEDGTGQFWKQYIHANDIKTEYSYKWKKIFYMLLTKL